MDSSIKNTVNKLLHLADERKQKRLNHKDFVSKVTADIIDFTMDNNGNNFFDEKILEYSADLDGLPEFRSHKEMTIKEEESLLIKNIEKLKGMV